MAQGRHLYRSRNAVFGGVCAGIANYFRIDPLIVRILAVVLGVLTVGVVAIGYLVLWAVLKKEPAQSTPLEIEPSEVKSENYGAVDCDAARGRSSRRSAASLGATSGFAGTGHIPPEPPAAARWRSSSYGGASSASSASRANSASAGTSGASSAPASSATVMSSAAAAEAVAASMTGGTAPSATSTSGDAASSAAAASAAAAGTAKSGGSAANRRAAAAAEVSNEGPAKRARRRRKELSSDPGRAKVVVALIVGGLLLFVIFSVLAANSLDGVSWWMFWPLLLVIFGIVRMIVPAPHGYRVNSFVLGVVLFSCGTALLPMSIGVVSWETIGTTFTNLWFLLLASLALTIVGLKTESAAAMLVAGLLFMVYCFGGLAWYAIPGSLPDLALQLPMDRELRLIDFENSIFA